MYNDATFQRPRSRLLCLEVCTLGFWRVEVCSKRELCRGQDGSATAASITLRAQVSASGASLFDLCSLGARAIGKSVVKDFGPRLAYPVAKTLAGFRLGNDLSLRNCDIQPRHPQQAPRRCSRDLINWGVCH